MKSKKLNVLYIEDNIKVIESMSFFLNMSFNKIYLCNNGKEALTTYLENKDDIDLIITELDIPTLSGIEMIEEIRKTEDNIPIFILSEQISLINRAKELGVKEFFKKPVLDIFEMKRIIGKYF